MKVFYDNFKKDFKEDTFIALGNFDGVHAGHKRIINKMKKKADELNISSMVYTFKNHPLKVIENDSEGGLITTLEEKIQILRDLDIDIVNFATFTEEYMKISAREFIFNLVTRYNMKGIVVGPNNRFGHKNEGDITLLKQLGEEFGFEVIVEEFEKDLGTIISSTVIREEIKLGNVEVATKYLTRPYKISGTVVNGKKLGRTIGFPTANVLPSTKYLIPKRGVYYTNVSYMGSVFKAITNVGFNPTVNGQKLIVESHLLNFDKFIYGEVIEVSFIKRIRDEQKFGSIEELKAQLQRDLTYAKNENRDK